MVVSEGEGGVSGRVGEPGEVSRGAAPAGYEPTHRRNHRCVTAATTGLTCRHVSFPIQWSTEPVSSESEL